MLLSRPAKRGRNLLAVMILLLGAAGSALAEKDLVKKTLDGRCLAVDHPDYWKTKIYVAKPSMEACIESGGRRG